MEDLRKLAGDRIVEDLSRGAEAYLQMWERAEGIPPRRCRTSRARLTRRGLGQLRLGRSPQRLLSSAGQPIARKRAWRWCVAGARNRGAKAVAVFTGRGRVGLVGSAARGHRVGRVGRGTSARRLGGSVPRLGRGLLVRRVRGGARVVYGVTPRQGDFVAVASRPVGRSPKVLRRYAALSGLRR